MVPLWKTLIDKKTTRLERYEAANLSKGTITKMGKNEPAGLEFVLRIATAQDKGDFGYCRVCGKTETGEKSKSIDDADTTHEHIRATDDMT